MYAVYAKLSHAGMLVRLTLAHLAAIFWRKVRHVVAGGDDLTPTPSLGGQGPCGEITADLVTGFASELIFDGIETVTGKMYDLRALAFGIIITLSLVDANRLNSVSQSRNRLYLPSSV